MSGEDILYYRFPSEIIADEYLHADNKNGSVYIFSDQNNTDALKEAIHAFEMYGFSVPHTHRFPIEEKKKVLDNLEEISNIDHSQSTCFVLLFLGTIKGQNEEYRTENPPFIKGAEVWRKIMTCKTLKYRPKICMFHGFRKLSDEQMDASVRAYEPPKYDIPVESDMLVMYKATEGYNLDSTYFTNLWQNIDKFGGRDDLMNIISYTKCNSSDSRRPITISTLRKKFYVTPSQFRLHWYDINNSTAEMMNHISTIRKVMSNINQFNHNEMPPTPIPETDAPKENQGLQRNTSTTRSSKRGRYSYVKSKVDTGRKCKQ